ncbi:methyltransferase-like protein 25 isoform X2 [Cryptotermes secundus]|uniref:methyltransferase-like protein 25 isoform X2 n=1 Tax=Cryptotermes secundus TaxID=105785 RepID=UPI000CD7D072|nr:methyltransferase-like protein 25 isoform X2 [Cryptotermes secundus]
MLLTELETSACTENKRMTIHDTPQFSRMDLPIHCAAFTGLSLLNTRGVPFAFVGDEAFALSTHLLRPYSGTHLPAEKRVSNYRLARARHYVECSFGILSSKWRILHKQLDKRWNGLCQRTNILKQGDVPPCKGKHRKPHNNANSTKGCECTGAEADINCRLQSESSALYKQVTMFVTQQTDLCSLVKDHFNSDRCEHLSITGLHTCGDLAPACLRIFANKEECGSVSNVGCCYHLMEEEYVRSPFWTDTNPPLPTGVQPGFPVSKCLHMQEFSLGRNARMLAAHSLDRIGEYHELSSESLFFRALLQVLLLKKCGNDIPWGQVGRLKYHNFVDYVQKAVKKLCLSIEVSTDEIVSLYKTHSVEQQQLHVFFLLRVALAPVIEAVILLDRLLYLLEQGIQDSYLVQLFDPVISPRCYCIVSLKNYPGKGTD